MSNDTPVTVIGNLTADPELGYAPSGAAWCRFTVASTPRRFDKASGEYVDADTLFMRCTAWRELAENVTESLTKGMRVVVTGRLRQSSWETDTGEKRSSIDLDVDDIGPSLRWATATVKRTQRAGHHDGPPPPTEDPWATHVPATQPTQPTSQHGAAGRAEEPLPVGAGSVPARTGYDQPPF